MQNPPKNRREIKKTGAEINEIETNKETSTKNQ
jgi:hypothetical protein